jgi:uncharacterized protein (DUF4415 family)
MACSSFQQAAPEGRTAAQTHHFGDNITVLSPGCLGGHRRQRRGKGQSTKKVSRKQAKDLKALAAFPDKKIDLSDLPEVRDWSGAIVGKFYRPIKTPVTIRIDADVLAWLKSQGRGYQTRINNILRGAMKA